MSRIRILYTIPNFKTAGSQYVLLSIFKNINRAVFDPFICIEKFPEAVPSNISQNRTLHFEWNHGIFQNIKNFKKLLKQNGIDLVHSWDYKSNYLEALACRTAGVKYLYTKKNNAWSKRWQLKSWLSNHIAYDNPAMKGRFFDSILFQNKVTFIPHGVDVQVFKPMEKMESETFDICCIGNIGENKNQLFIVEALKNLPENIVLHLFGKEEKEYRKKLDDYIDENGLANRVYFHGFVKNTAISEVFRKMDLFVLASFQEGLPVSILEAMACGVPVLSSDSGGGARFLLDSKFIFSLNNTEELACKIHSFYTMIDSERNEIGAMGFEKIIQNQTIEKEVLAYEKLYQKIISK